MGFSYLGLTRRILHLGGDTIAPSCVLTSAASDPVYDTFSVTATFSEDVTGFVAGDVTVTNGTASNLAGSGDTYTFDVTPSDTGAVTVQVGAGVCQDGAGNPNTASNTLERYAIVWLLLDRFDTNRAAGAVDGTDAEPGPGSRTTVELNGATVSIESNQAKLVGSSTAPSDCVLGYDVTGIDTTRATGKAVLIEATYGGAGATYDYVSPGDYASDVRIQTTPGKTLFRDNSTDTASQVDDEPSLSQAYEYVFINRPTGNFFLIDGNLMAIGRVDTTAFDLAAIGSVTHSTKNMLLDDVRLVQLSATDSTLYPIPVLSDSFNRSDGAIGSTDGAGHLEGQTTPQGDGVAYSNASTWTISSNVATNTPSVAADYLCYAAGGDAEVFHSVKVTRSAGEAGIVLNAADTNNYIRVVHDGTNVITTEVVSGTPNVLSTVAKAYSAGARLEARRIGNTVRVFYNKIFIVEVTPNAALQNNTAHGLYSDSSGNTFDNLESWPTTGYSYTEYA